VPVNRVLPDNCIDVIFDLRAQLPPFVVGPMLTAEVMPQFEEIDMLGVRFCPGAATEFVDLRAADLTAAHVDTADVWPDSHHLAEQLWSSQYRERPAILDAWLARRRRTRSGVALARRATVAIEHSGGRLTVERLAAVVCASDRTLLRTFEAAVGVRPKAALRVQRFRVAAALLEHRRGAESRLVRIAADCGYADQAHLTREFKAMSGLTPAAYCTERRLVGFLQD
jgi:AraC-like DNA-binding protein